MGKTTTTVIRFGEKTFMSFVTAVRDYVDLINANFDSFHQTFGSEMTLAAFTKGTALYLLQSLKIAFLYVFTLQWLRDLAYLPVIIPDFTFDIFRTVFVKYPSLPVTTSAMSFFSGAPTLVQNKLVVGFFNSFFAALPLTFAHLISARQFYVKGWRAAAATNAGIIAGHMFFLAAVLFGWRPVLMPWLKFEPGTFLIAIVVTYYTIKSTFGRSAFQQIVTIPDYAKTAGVGFLLMLCDQGVLFKYLSTLTGGLEPTYLEPITGTAASSLTQQNVLYLFGFLFGSVAFTGFFFWLAAGLRQAIATMMNISYITFAARVNSLSQIAFIATLCISLSFYGLDFLCAKPLGFVPYDRALVPGTFASYTLEDKQLGIRGVPSRQEAVDITQPDVAVTKQQKAQLKKKSILNKPIFPLNQDFDLSSFDRGVYLRQAVGSIHETKTPESYRIPTSEFWASRTIRRKVPRGIFAHLLRLQDRGFFTRLQESLGFRMGREPPENTREQRELDASLQSRIFKSMRRCFVLAQAGSNQRFDQFKVYFNSTDPFTALDPVTGQGHPGPKLTKTQLKIVRQMDALLNVSQPEREANLDRLDQLVDKYAKTQLDYREATFASRFNLVENMTADFFEGQKKSQVKAKRKLSMWPYMFGYVHEEDGNKALKQRVLHKRLRQNPYVVTLFRSDIDTFLSRQPKDQLLTAKEEAELFFKRVMMKNLVQTKLQKSRLQNPLLALTYKGGKSLSSRAYNHQFNGTFKVVRQFLRTDLDLMDNRDSSRIMKFDMPLFRGTKDKMTSVHEELFQQLNEKNGNNQSSTSVSETRPRRANTRPFYAGWDDDRRAFVLTNRFLPVRVTSRAMRFNEKYPEFAPFDELGTKRKLKAKVTKKGIKRIAFTTWPISQRIAQDPLLYRSHPSAFMADTPNRHDVRLPSRDELSTKAGRKKRSKARSERALIQHFIPDFDFRPLQVLFEEADRPNVDIKKARSIAKRRTDELSPSDEGEVGYSTMDRWPAGFIVYHKPENVWWLEEKPPVPFADRGGYVWPGHEQLKINMRRYLPQWKAPAFKVQNPFAKLAKDVKD